jgi:hypothetical protein
VSLGCLSVDLGPRLMTLLVFLWLSDIQAIARCHRIGQTKKVKVIRLICQDSVEDQMQSRIRKKLYLSAKVRPVWGS